MERDLTFRDAQMKDAEGLAEIGRETFAETFGDLYPPGDLRQFLDDTYSIPKMQADLGDPDVEVRIAFSGKKMAAYCKIGPCKLPMDTGPEPALELHRVYVYEARQGVGAGRILLAWAIERGKAARREEPLPGRLAVQRTRHRALRKPRVREGRRLQVQGRRHDG